MFGFSQNKKRDYSAEGVALERKAAFSSGTALNLTVPPTGESFMETKLTKTLRSRGEQRSRHLLLFFFFCFLFCLALPVEQSVSSSVVIEVR